MIKNITKIKKILQSYLTPSEQNILFFILMLLLFGSFLTYIHYSPSDSLPINIEESNLQRLYGLLKAKYAPLYNLNKVTADELILLQGVGPATAKQILDYQQNMGFQKVEDLMNIKGIGTKKFNALKEFFFVDSHNEVANLEQSTNHLLIHSSEKTLPSGSTKININTASENELITLTGIGPKRAQDIIQYRTQYGVYRKIEDLQNVKGIGPKTFEKIMNQISTEE